jgi:hypothetical protein
MGLAYTRKSRALARRRGEEQGMLVFFSDRYLKPGAWEQFRRAWDPGGDLPEGVVAIYHARSLKDENEVISFGIFEGTREDVNRIRGGGSEEAELKRQEEMAPFVKNVFAEGIYEVIEEIKP